MKLEAVVRQFENSNEGYIKIRKTLEEKVVRILSDVKPLLSIVLLSLTESMRKDPFKYSPLIYHNNTSSNTEYNSQNYETASYGQHKQYPLQDYICMLREEAERLYTKLAKQWVDKIITDYASSISSLSLPVLSLSDEKEQQPRPLLQRSFPEAEPVKQLHIPRIEEHGFIQSEIDNDDEDN